VRLVGKSAADFTLKDLQGQKVSLSDFQGKIVLLDFWATWCPPCREELPSIDKLYRTYKDKDLAVLGINDEDSGTVKSFLKKNDYSLPTLVDSKRSVHRIYGARAIPTVVVIDRKGVIVAHFVGSRPETELVAALKTAGL
jgi:peroxiredoxin